MTPGPANDPVRVFLADAYRTRLRRAGKTVEPPIAVGELLTADCQPPTLVVAGLLHDVLEDTDVKPAELQKRFGSDVARLVEALTQDTAIVKYGERKAALRDALRFGEGTVRWTPYRRAHEGERLLAEACRNGWEGLIAKRADSRYVHGRSREQQQPRQDQPEAGVHQGPRAEAHHQPLGVAH